ncbi:MAG: serpin family protein [Deltaproteobacteria bacterium]|nr:serpin family protein [Deltaproteobacteria bacterium]
MVGKNICFNAQMLLLFSPILLVLSGCGSDNDSKNDTFDNAFDVLSGDVERNTTPDVSATDIKKCVDGNTQFAMDLYGQLTAESDDNLFYSPYSISVALSMAYGGAEGNTQSEMQSTMHFDLAEPALYYAFNALDLELAGRGQNAAGMDGEPFQLHIVNDTWGQKDYEFLDDYLDLLSGYYGADLKILDFAGNTEGAREAINGYISEQTNDRINDLLPEGSIKPVTRMVLTNVIYFNAAWSSQFERESTSPELFTSFDGTERDVPTMHQTEVMQYMTGDGFEAVSLAYDGGEMSMMLVLPAKDTFGDFENNLSADLLQNIFDGLESTRVRLSLPSFELAGDSISLKTELEALGMEAPFSSDADFSGMTGNRELLIGNVIHKAFIKVNEDGTEAAAATAVIMDGNGAPLDEPDPIVVQFNRPFFFVIRDNPTNTVLFAGRLVTL